MPQAPLGERLALLTDLYQLTMAACYFDQGMNEEATFSLFIRKYPKNRGYFVAAGLSEALEFLATLHFSEEDLAYLEATALFRAPFLDFLKTLRFTGEVQALPEGSIFFKDEPLLEVSAPIIEAQLVETFLINAVNLQSLIASKAARAVYAAKGRPLVDFSLRRTQGTDAGLKVARASYLAGFKMGLATTLAVVLHEIPHEFSNFGVLVKSGFSKGKALFLNFITALAALAGGLLAWWVGGSTEGFIRLLIPLTAGGFIYIAGSDLVPQLHKDVKSLRALIQFLAILAGVGLMLLLKFLE